MRARGLAPAVVGPMVAMLVGLTACTQRAAPSSTTATAATVFVAHQPPTGKDVIQAVLASGDIPLNASPTCTNVGTAPSDSTIGQYLAGFLAELSAPNKQNWIETRIDTTGVANGEPVIVCDLVLRHVDGDDRWGWGVRFNVRKRDGLVLRESFTCTGAG